MRYGLTKPHIVASAPAASLAVKTTRSSSSSSSSSASASSPSSLSSSDGGGAAALSGYAKGSFSDSGSAASSVDSGGFSSEGRGLGTIQSTLAVGGQEARAASRGSITNSGSIVDTPFIILLMIAGCFLLAAQ